MRVDAGVSQGSEIGVKFDPMLAKLICYAESRDACIDRLDRALRDYIVLGTKTNISFLCRVVTHQVFRQGQVSTSFIAEHEESLRAPSDERVPLIAVALAAAPRERPMTTVWDSLGSWGRN